MNMMPSVDEMIEQADPLEMIKEIDRLKYEGSFAEFFAAAWHTFDPSPFFLGAPIYAVAEHLEAVANGDIKRLIINIPPRMSKSSLTSVAFPPWVWAQRHNSPTSGPGVRFLHASYSSQLSMRDSVSCRRLLESPWYQFLWGERFLLTSDQNTKTRFDNNKNGSRLCTSVGSTLTGEGGNIIIVDDPNAAQEAFSEATIQTTIDWWDTALSTRLNDAKNGAFIVIQQRLAENDLTGHILSKDVGEWTHLMLPMRYEPDRSFVTSIGWEDWRTEEGELLWPERFGEAEVRQLEATLGPYGAAGQLQQRPEVKGGGIIKREWWQLWEHEVFPPLDYIVASLDTAYTTKQENDQSALTVWGVFSQDPIAQSSKAATGGAVERTYNFPIPKVILLHAWADRLELHELVHKVASSCKRFKVDKLLIENKAAGISVSQELRRLYATEGFAVQLMDTGAQDKMARLYSVQHLFSEEMIYAPDRNWADMVITQCAAFPKAKHDDIVDTVSQALRHLRTTGILQRSQEVQHDIYESMQFTGSQPPPLYPV